MLDNALAGAVVLDLTRLLPGPLCTLILGDLGAEVIKIEDPRMGDYLRVMPPMAGSMGARFAVLNRGKRSAIIDLKSAAGREAFFGLVETAQVVVETFRPGVMDRLGVGFEALKARNPKIVLCSITGYGQTGPYTQRAGHDVNYIATAGVLDQSGHQGGEPELPGVQVGDCSGALWGVIGTVAALKKGTAEHVDVSMTEAAMSFALPMLGIALATGKATARGSDTLSGGPACYGVYPTKDGHMSVGALEPKFWVAFCEAIGRKSDPGADLVAPLERQAEIRAEVTELLTQRTTYEWMQVFGDKDVCCEPVIRPEQAPEHPLHKARQNFFEHEGVKYVRTPLGAASTTRGAPQHGEHTVEIMGQKS